MEFCTETRSSQSMLVVWIVHAVQHSVIIQKLIQLDTERVVTGLLEEFVRQLKEQAIEYPQIILQIKLTDLF